MAETVLKNPFEEFSRGIYTVVNNTWNISRLKANEPSTQTIRFDSETFPGNIHFSWDYGTRIADSVLAYPEIVAGYRPWTQTGSGELTSAINNLCDFKVSVDHSIFGETAKFNVAFDLWLTNKPHGDQKTITTELMIWLHGRDILADGPPVSHYAEEPVSGNVYVKDGFGGQDGVTWRYIAVVADKDVAKGTIDIAAILKFLTSKNLVDGNDFVGGFEFGNEVTAGHGGMVLKSMSYTFKTCSSAKNSIIPHQTKSELSSKNSHLYSSYVEHAGPVGSIDMTGPHPMTLWHLFG